MSFLLAFLSGASLKKGPGWLQARSLHPQPTLGTQFAGPGHPLGVMQMSNGQKEKASYNHGGADTYGGSSMEIKKK